MLPRRYFRTDLINWNPAIEAVDEYIYVQQGSASVQYKSEYKRTARFQVLPREALSGTFQFILWMLWFYPRLVKSEFEAQNEKVGSRETAIRRTEGRGLPRLHPRHPALWPRPLLFLWRGVRRPGSRVSSGHRQHDRRAGRGGLQI